jgi:hypothetical protein
MNYTDEELKDFFEKFKAIFGADIRRFGDSTPKMLKLLRLKLGTPALRDELSDAHTEAKKRTADPKSI